MSTILSSNGLKKPPQFLSKVYDYPGFDEAALETIFQAHRCITFSKDDFISAPGTIADGYFCLEKGLVRGFVSDFQHQERTIDFYSAGDIVMDVVSLFQRQPSGICLQALTPAQAWYIAYPDFQHLYLNLPGFSEWGRNWMTGELLRLRQRSIAMVTLPAKDRYLDLQNNRPEILLEAPLKYIATYLGITDTSLSRLRKELKEEKQGLIR